MIESLGLQASIDPAQLAPGQCIHFEYAHEASYRVPATTEYVHGLLLHADGDLHAVLTSGDMRALLPELSVDTVQELHTIATRFATSPVCLTRPLTLEPVCIPKPWGQEVWYSGIEARGVCTVAGVSLAWLVDIFGNYLGCSGAPMLLKILDPYPDTNLGDLYFEMHREKVEVYVVTHVDESAWPDGRGRIRYGFNQQKMRGYADTRAFLDDYVAAVKAYRDVRDRVDEALDQAGRAAGLAPDAMLSPDRYNALLDTVDTALVTEEQALRDAMYEFTAIREIIPGDVIIVEPLVPHSLQHGVRVIEFQTPHYERYILSFGQKVLTQSHWDTEQAIDKAATGDLQFEQPRSLGQGRDLIADFNAFRVERITLQAGQRLALRPAGYSMAIGVTGDLQLSQNGSQVIVRAEQAFLNPGGHAIELANTGETTATLLVAQETD